MKKSVLVSLIFITVLGIAHTPVVGQQGIPINYDFGRPDPASGWREIIGSPSDRKMLFPSGVEVKTVSFKSPRADFDIVFYSSYSAFGFFSIGIGNPDNAAFLARQSEKNLRELTDSLVANGLPRSRIKASRGQPFKGNGQSGVEYPFELEGLAGTIRVLWQQGIPLILISQPEKVTSARVVEFFLNSNQGVISTR